MSQQNNVQAGVEAIGSKSIRAGSRTFPILAKDFTSVEQAVPLRLLYGQDKFAGVQITPIFDFQSEQTMTSGGK